MGGFGVRGWLKVSPFSPAPESVLKTARRWWLAPSAPPAGARSSTEPRPPIRCLSVVRAKAQGGVIVAQCDGLADREQADVLKGCDVSVARADFPGAGPQEYYWVDLIGCRVTNPAGDDFGEVVAVEDHGAHPLLVVGEGAEGGRMIPFVAQFILSVDVAGRAIVADWQRDY
jgi:16S rRNA processing protein RimM